MIGMKCIFGVGNYLKYKVVEIRNNFVFMIIVKFKYCIYVWYEIVFEFFI